MPSGTYKKNKLMRHQRCGVRQRLYPRCKLQDAACNMKILLLLLLSVIYAEASGDSCTPLSVIVDGNLQNSPCIVIIDGVDNNIADDGEDNCTTLSATYNALCCMYNGRCVIKDSGVTPSGIDTTSIEDELLNSANNTATEAQLEEETDPATAGQRSLLTGPGFPSLCLPPPSFPAICKPTRKEPYVLDPPVDIPYCVRIPCKPLGNAPLEKNLKACGTQPGCYFDKALSEYREAFGPSVLPGVPVCHLAIRNKFFRTRSLAVSKKYGSWNPYFTYCLLKTFDKEIRAGPKGCELLPILDAFNVIPKMAGWKNINPYECALIDGCWRRGSGCFYPVDISKVRVKSGQRPIIFNKNEIVYGRPRCQVFDKSSSLSILKSYHRCLSSGCIVDSKILSHYYNHLYTIGECLTPSNHRKYWNDVERGQIAAHNIDSSLHEYGKCTPVPVSHTSPSPTSVFDIPQDKNPCGFPHWHAGRRPCPPPSFPLKRNPHCPFKPFHVPRFPTLAGKFDGCCDINECYLPKSDISEMHSGPSFYYTEWSLFTACSATCGQGEKRRHRKCISDDQRVCTKKLVDIKTCQVCPCSSWTDWSAFPPCAKTCGVGGVQTRTRECKPKGGHCRGHCEGSAEDTRECAGPPCKDIPWNPVWG